MDLDVFELSDAPQKMPLKNRDGKPADAFLFVRGTHTPEYKREMFKLTKKMGKLLKIDQKGEMAIDFSGVDPETEMTITAQRTALLITGWEGLTKGGQPYPYSKEAAVALVLKNDFIAEQVLAFAGAQSNFLPVSDPELSALQSGSEN